jgi:hypothetical protein
MLGSLNPCMGCFTTKPIGKEEEEEEEEELFSSSYV